MRVAFVGAHPDDIEIMCGGTLIKHLKRGDEVLYIVVCNGEKSGEISKRENELIKSIKFLNIKNFRFLKVPDTKIPKYFYKIKEILEEEITNFKPERIYTHSPNDYHQDHRILSKITMIVGRRIPQILGGWTRSTIYFKPRYFIDISEYIKDKINLLKIYESQVNSNRINIESIIGINKAWGWMNNKNYAEAFEVLKFLEL